MYNWKVLTLYASASIAMVSCVTHYRMECVARSRIVIDNRYDNTNDTRAQNFIAPYRAKVDSVMSPVVGTAARYLDKYQPESPLSNLMADILLWGGKAFGEKPDFAVYNIGGIRAAFAKGDVTYGDVLDVAPFENKICFCSLTGDKVAELFQQMADFGGQGVSHGVEAVMDGNNRITRLLINGQPVDPKRQYRIATLDYVAEGNDKMLAFKSKTNVNSPQGAENNVRFIIINYFRQAARQGKAVDARVEGRFTQTKQ